ncbi:MAG: hypothetical protein ACJAUH_001407 [Saprospiraceae bacterium]|mgnify:CR=1 FL=1|jgi:hypothetical protein|tara:strand:- start:779 stop:1681 length:903 start_codon:yes stop_codon:yes gene_type:complete
MKRSIILSIAICLAVMAQAQEFQAKVTVNTPKLQSADPKIFVTLQNSIRDMLNNTKWSEDVFEPVEQIQLTITINIKEEISATSFKADMAIQAVRPVYNSSYETVIFASQDQDVKFTYEEYQPVEFSKNTFTDNLSSILGFYAYTILGLDYDSFSELGGDPHFQEAQNIVSTIPSNIAQSAGGWTSIEKGQRSRYWLIENILNPRMIPYRKAIYLYYRGGLDRMADDSETALTACATAITQIAEANKAYRNSMIIQIFAQMKSTEILQIFINANTTQKQRVYKAMIQLDAANTSKYAPIR